MYKLILYNHSLYMQGINTCTGEGERERERERERGKEREGERQ
jgi:hypothetical protein